MGGPRPPLGDRAPVAPGGGPRGNGALDDVGDEGMEPLGGGGGGGGRGVDISDAEAAAAAAGLGGRDAAGAMLMRRARGAAADSSTTGTHVTCSWMNSVPVSFLPPTSVSRTGTAGMSGPTPSGRTTAPPRYPLKSSVPTPSGGFGASVSAFTSNASETPVVDGASKWSVTQLVGEAGHTGPVPPLMTAPVRSDADSDRSAA